MSNDRKPELGGFGGGDKVESAKAGHADRAIEERDAAKAAKAMKRPPVDKQVKGPEESK